MYRTQGKVYLIGAGPGDPGLLTLKGAESIRRSQTLVVDRLINPRILQHAHPEAQRIYVGKQPGSFILSQPEINQVLINEAQAGKIVARIKGGDPFVFGRGGEEAVALREAGIDFEIVSGVSSATAAACYAGIPVTHRHIASSFAVVTGHELVGSDDSINWESLANGVDTLVFLMSMATLKETASKLIENGRSRSTPTAVIEWGTCAKQRTVVGTLSTIHEKVQEAGLGAPAVVIVGEVVELRSMISWFEKRPLFGKRIVVTRSEERASSLVAALEDLGAEVIELPMIEYTVLDYTPELDSALEGSRPFDWVIFSSAIGVTSLTRILKRSNRDIRCLAGMKIASIGEATAKALEDINLQVDFCPSEFTGEAFVDEFPSSDFQNILLVRASQGRSMVPDRLAALGHTVTVAPVYNTDITKSSAESLEQVFDAGVDIVTFTSSSTVSNFARLLYNKDLPHTVKVVTIGPITSATARELGFTVFAEASFHTVDGLVDAILAI